MTDLTSRISVTGLSAILCFIPLAIVGISSDLSWKEWFAILPVYALFLGLPQVMLFVVVLVARKRFTRIASLLISCIALIAFFTLQLDINASSSSTASLSYFFVQLLILPYAAFAIIISVIVRRAKS